MHMPPIRMIIQPKPILPSRLIFPAMRPIIPGSITPKPVPVRPAVISARLYYPAVSRSMVLLEKTFSKKNYFRAWSL